jgi:4-hydroxy-2-oxoglutarate aldolase
MFTGIYAPIPTPFSGEGDIAWDQWRQNLAWWGATPLAGIVVAGTNGEAAYLDAEEKERAFAFVREQLPAALKVVAGTGCESTRETLLLSRRAARAGVDAVLVLNPYYYRGGMTAEALKKHYFTVAEDCPVPVIVYNMPRNTGFNMEAGLITSLSEHPNIVGLKDSSGNIVQISEVVAGAGESFAVFAGSANFLLPALLMGAVGGTLALANIMPRECVEIYDLYRAGRVEEARELQRRVLEANAAVTSRWGVPGLKAALDLMGYYGGPPRPPLTPLSAALREDLKAVLARAGVL